MENSHFDFLLTGSHPLSLVAEAYFPGYTRKRLQRNFAKKWRTTQDCTPSFRKRGITARLTRCCLSISGSSSPTGACRTKRASRWRHIRIWEKRSWTATSTSTRRRTDNLFTTDFTTEYTEYTEFLISCQQDFLEKTLLSVYSVVKSVVKSSIFADAKTAILSWYIYISFF